MNDKQGNGEDELRAKAVAAAARMVVDPIDATEVNQYIPKFEVGEVVTLADQRMEVWTMTEAGMVLDGVRRATAFWPNRLFTIKGYYFRVLACEGVRVSLVPHGRTRFGVKVRRDPTTKRRIAYENVKEKK